MFPATTQPGGVHTTASPLDVCRTPIGGGAPIPIPYANMVDGLALSGDAAGKKTQKKIIDDAAKKGRNVKSATAASIMSQGDEAGTRKGMVYSKSMGKTQYRMSSAKVSAEGTGIVRFGSMSTHGGSSSNAPTGTQIAPSQSKVLLMGDD